MSLLKAFSGKLIPNKSIIDQILIKSEIIKELYSELNIKENNEYDFFNHFVRNYISSVYIGIDAILDCDIEKDTEEEIKLNLQLDIKIKTLSNILFLLNKDKERVYSILKRRYKYGDEKSKSNTLFLEKINF